LKAAGATKPGGAIIREISPTIPSFFLQAYVYDTGCTGAAWISPLFGACTTSGAPNKPLLPGMSIGAGIKSSANKMHYATTYPWTAALGVNRTVGWHTIAFRGNTTTLEIIVDGTVAKVTNGTSLSKIMLRSDPMLGASSGADFYWDAIFAAPYEPSVSTVVGPEENVLMDASMVWTHLSVNDGPAARQGHTAVTDGTHVYLHGGERSGYEYSDVWQLAPSSRQWSFLAPKGSTLSAPGRHDHSTVLHHGNLYVYGGRGPQALGDFWTFSLTSSEWTQLAVPFSMAPRFGHSAVVIGDEMIVYGGYIEAEHVFSTDVWTYHFTKATWTHVGPQVTSLAGPSAPNLNEAIVLPTSIPNGRSAHLALAGSGSNQMDPSMYYIIGGLKDDSVSPLEDAWVFDPAKREWAPAAFTATFLQAIARYDSGIASFDRGTRLLVFGGLSNGEILGGEKGDTYTLYIGT